MYNFILKLFPQLWHFYFICVIIHVEKTVKAIHCGKCGMMYHFNINLFPQSWHILLYSCEYPYGKKDNLGNVLSNVCNNILERKKVYRTHKKIALIFFGLLTCQVPWPLVDITSSVKYDLTFLLQKIHWVCSGLQALTTKKNKVLEGYKGPPHEGGNQAPAAI